MSFTPNTRHEVKIPCNAIQLDGFLYLPEDAEGLVLFAHGSGSSRYSTRNQHIATYLNKARLGTLLFDLLTPEEEHIDAQTNELRFDIDLLAKRLIEVTNWCQNTHLTMNIGYFGSSTGAGAALVAAARKEKDIKVVVSRGGRPDMARQYLPHVKAATLLIVGGNDDAVITLNKKAMAQMHSITTLEIVEGASHLFEEPGTLDNVARLARNWFLRYLAITP